MLVHRECLIRDDVPDNAQLVTQLLQDLDYGAGGTYVVWYQNFENQRNAEMSLMYPDTKHYFDTVVSKTFDLMDVFKSFAYFHRGFS